MSRSAIRSKRLAVNNQDLLALKEECIATLNYRQNEIGEGSQVTRHKYLSLDVQQN